MNPKQQSQSTHQRTSADARPASSTLPERQANMQRQPADDAAFDSEDQRPTRDALFAIYNQ